MPLYEFQCEKCHHRFEKIQKFSDPLPDVCPSCGAGPLVKLPSSPAIQFKGTGWYITDYAKKSGTDAGKTGSGEKGDSGSSSGGGSGTSGSSGSPGSSGASSGSGSSGSGSGASGSGSGSSGSSGASSSGSSGSSGSGGAAKKGE